MRPLFLLLAVLSLNAQLPKPGSGNGGNAGASAVGTVGTMQTSDGAGNLGSSNAVQDPVTGIENHAKAVGWKFATVSFNAGSPVFDVSAGNLLKLTLTAAATATLSNAPAAGWAGVITVCQDSTGGWTLTWPASFQGYPDVSLIALSTCMAVPSYYDGTNMNVSSSPYVFNGSGSVVYLKGASTGSGKLQPPATVSASTIWQLPDLGATDTAVFAAFAQTLTNKTLTNPNLGANSVPSALTQSCLNDGSTGTTNATLVKISAANTCVKAATTDTDGMIGITVSGGGTSGSSVYAVGGTAACVFDNATTLGDWVQIASGTAGNCHDTGSTTRPLTGGQVIGRVWTTNGAGGTYNVQLQLQTARTPVIQMPSLSWTNLNPAASTTYYMTANGTLLTTQADARDQAIAPAAMTLTALYLRYQVRGTLASSGNVTATLLKNNASCGLTFTFVLTGAGPTTSSDIAHTCSVAAGDVLQVQLVTPAWGTAPTSVDAFASLAGTQ